MGQPTYGTHYIGFDIAPCETCFGKGVVMVNCGNCDGAGTVTQDSDCGYCSGTGRVNGEEKCSHCKYGRVDGTEDCSKCDGSGKIWETE